MTELSLLIGNDYSAFEVDETTFLVAKIQHPNQCWSSRLEFAPDKLPDPITGGRGPAPIVNVYSNSPPPETICIQTIDSVTLSIRFDSQDKQHVYVQDGYGYHQVPIFIVE